jgi:hypothetical protein
MSNWMDDLSKDLKQKFSGAARNHRGGLLHPGQTRGFGKSRRRAP